MAIKKRVTVTVSLDQTRIAPETEDDGEFKDEKFETVTVCDGTLRVYGGKIEIIYDEDSMTELIGCEVRLSFPLKEPGRVTMLRDGLVRTVLMFCEGERYLSVYETEYGSFELGVVTEKCENNVTADGGEMRIIYTVELRGTRAERNDITINIRTV